jgi:hypothetical protein
MKTLRLILATTFVLGLFLALPVAAGAANGAVGIHSVAACKDSTTVAVIGTSTYANNRLRVDLYSRNAEGKEELKAQVHTAPFGGGRISEALQINYFDSTLPAGSTVRVDVQLQRLSGSDYVDVGWLARQYVTVADKSCRELCSVTVDTTDAAPSTGTLTLRSHYGSWFRPEGWLHGAVPVSKGRPARATFVGIPCTWTVRAWYYPSSGDTAPLMLPSQYWPSEFAATIADGTNPYTTAFARGLPATDPLEPSDPFIAP